MAGRHALIRSLRPRVAGFAPAAPESYSPSEPLADERPEDGRSSVVYRIRFRDVPGQGEQEVLVEAHNTTEALVKFCHAHGPGAPAGQPARGLSICPEAADELVDPDPSAWR